MTRPKWEVADVLRLCEDDIKRSKSLPKRVKKTAMDIIRCRTAALGGHQLFCKKCGHTEISYNSCRNRHCPKCQYSKREQWVLDRDRDVLPVKYFHVVFTIPSELNPVAKAYPGVVYRILFQTAWYTINTLAKDRKWLGAQTGMLALLHTWGQNLSLHPHLHCLIPNGGYDPDLRRWIYPKSKRFLFPVRVMSKMFRGAFLRALDKAYQRREIVWTRKLWSDLRKVIDRSSFNIYAKVPFGGPDQIIQYLARYSHRVAITNRRIQHVRAERVCFKYKDYRDGATKSMQLTPQQFASRFLQHVLPKGLAKIRHYGIFSNRNKNHLIPEILLFFERRRKSPKTFSARKSIKLLYGYDIHLCPICKQGQMFSMELPSYCLPIRGDPYILLVHQPSQPLTYSIQ